MAFGGVQEGRVLGFRRVKPRVPVPKHPGAWGFYIPAYIDIPFENTPASITVWKGSRGVSLLP